MGTVHDMSAQRSLSLPISPLRPHAGYIASQSLPHNPNAPLTALQFWTGFALLAERLEAGADSGGGWFSNNRGRGRHHVFKPGSRALPSTRRDERPGRGGGDGRGGRRAQLGDLLVLA